MTAQHIINNLEFARKSLEIHGIIADSQLLRLKDLLATEGAQLSWWLSGNRSSDSTLHLELHVAGSLNLVCQRCLSSMLYVVDINNHYILNDDAVGFEDDESDEVDYLPIDEKMDVMNLIEDEVLLALPLAPKHDNTNCLASETVFESGKVNPFEALKALKLSKD